MRLSLRQLHCREQTPVTNHSFVEAVDTGNQTHAFRLAALRPALSQRYAIIGESF